MYSFRGIATEAQFTNGVPVREVSAVQGFPYVDTIPLLMCVLVI